MRISKTFVGAVLVLAAITLTMLPCLALPGVSAATSTPGASPFAVEQIECTNKAGGQFKAVALEGVRSSTVDFSGSGGQLDPSPLLETEINAASCVVVHFSAQADPQDNFIVFQASIDDIPMEGHAQFPYITPAPTTPVVFDPEETNLNVSRMLSYTFFAKVARGSHIVRIRFAGCCSSNSGNGAVVRAATMSVNY